MITRKISSSGTDVLNPLTGRHPVNSTILGRISGSAPPPVIYNNTSFPSFGSTVNGPPNPPLPCVIVIALYSDIVFPPIIYVKIHLILIRYLIQFPAVS